jgi:type II secretory pathway pseudopilin PulG
LNSNGLWQQEGNRAKPSSIPLGFNLIQCIITLAIIGILCAFSQPNYSQLWQKHSILSTIKAIQQYLQYARTLAITKHTKITILPITGNIWSSGITIKDNEQILKTFPLHKNLSLSWHGFGTPQYRICIYPNGMTYNNGHFIVKHKSKKSPFYTLFVSKMLRTHVEKN